MTPVQKDFKRMMKELEQEGKIPKQYNYKKKRRFYKKLTSLFLAMLVVVFLIWNRHSINSYISPIIGGSMESYNMFRPKAYETNPIANLGIQSEHKTIDEYLNTGKELNEKLSLIVRRRFKRTGDGDKYTEEEIQNELKELEVFKGKFSESRFVEYRINEIHLNNINIIQNMLNSPDGISEELYSLREEYGKNINQIQIALVEFLEANKIKYEVGLDQTITYYLQQPLINKSDDKPDVAIAETIDKFQAMENIQVLGETFKDISYKWEYPLGVKTWEYELSIPIETVNHYKSIDRNDIFDYSYYVTHEADDEYLSKLANVFKSTGEKESLSQIEIANLAVNFVQSIKYTPDDIGTGYDEYPKFPLETLYDEGGDCEDSSILLASLLRELGYGTVLVLFDNHMGVGIVSSQSANFKYEGQDYQYIESTNTGWDIGELPREFKGSPVKILPVNK